MTTLDVELHARQSLAFESEANEILYGGAAGGGKSHVQRVAAIAACVAIPGLQAYIFRRTYPELYDTHMTGPAGFFVLLASWIAAGHAKINLSEMRIDFPATRSAIHLCHCQHEKDVFRYQGAEIHFLLPDELTHFSSSMYAYLRGRVRLGGLEIPPEWVGKFPRILASTNPGGPGHNWVKAAWIDGHAPMEKWRAQKSDGGMLRQFIPAKLEDNPTLHLNDPDYADRLSGLGDPALVRAMLEGDWDIVAGGAIDDVWKRDRHVIAPFDLPSSWRLDRSFDWGSSHPFSVCWWAESDGSDLVLRDKTKRSSPKGTLFMVGEWYGWNGQPNKGLRATSSEISRGILQREKDWGFAGRVRPGPADSAIYAVEDGHSIAAEMSGHGVTWTESEKGPGSRVAGLEAVRRVLKAGLSFPLEDRGLFISESCPQAIRTLPVLPRDPRKPDDVDTASEDHIFDAVRYRVIEKAAPSMSVGRRHWG